MENVNYETKIKKPVNKDSLIIGIVVAVILLLTAGIVAYYFWGVNSEVLVEYNGGKITRGEYEAVYRYWGPQLVYYGWTANDIDQIIVDEILLNQVMYNKATEAGYSLTAEDKKATDDEFAKEDSANSLRANGINPDILKEFFYKNSVVSAYLKDYEEKTTTEQVKNYILETEGQEADLDLYRARHILIKVPETATEEEKTKLKKEAEDLLSDIKKGEDFAKLAQEHSDDTGTASEGGAFAMVNNDTVDESYRNAVLTLKAGDLHETVVASDFGYFIIKLESIEEDGRLTNSSDVSVYVNDYINDTITAAFNPDTEENKKQLEKVATVANKLNSELGIVANSEE